MIICSRFLSAFLVIIKNTAFLIIPLYQKNGYKCRKARLLLGLCLQSEQPPFLGGCFRFLFVQEEGLEPSWYCYHTDLNRARLPIPPLLHFLFCRFSHSARIILHIFFKMSSFFLFFFLLFLPVQVRVNSSASSRSLFCSERILRGRFCIKVHSVQNTKKPAPFRKQVSLPVQEEGLEPSWYCYHTDLNRARLPIPPLLHVSAISRSNSSYYIIKGASCQSYFYIF